jgi:hypothetical protein
MPNEKILNEGHLHPDSNEKWWWQKEITKV